MSDVSVAARELKDKILEQYLEGYSQKDIATRLKVTPKDIRTILNENGLETSRFRALDDSVTHVILLLITNGVRFNDIENVCNIAVHAIRDVVARNNLQRASKRARQEIPELTVPVDFVKNPAFLQRYLAGESFCALQKEFCLTDDQILYEFLSFTGAQIRKHNCRLRKKVQADAALHFSPTSIARKHMISMSIVRRMLQS